MALQDERWTVVDEIRHVDELLQRLGLAITEARTNDDHSLDDCLKTRDELLDLRTLLVHQRGPSE